MKTLFLLSMSLMSVTAFAKSEDAAMVLLNGSTLCASPNNPVKDALKKHGGDYFTALSISADGVVTAAMVRDPHVYNTSIMAPARMVGELQFKMGYQRSPNHIDNRLTCEIKVTTNIID